MAKYRITDLDLSTRMEIVTEMLKPHPERGWGRVTELAEEHDISRTWLYELRDRAHEAFVEALRPHSPGPQPSGETVVVDSAFVKRVIAVLPMLTGSVRNIQLGLDLLLGVQRSVGYISETLQQAGEAAAAYNEAVAVPQPVLAEADEIFQGQQPCLTVVDGRSFLVLTLTSAEGRDATTWGVTFLDLVDRGIQFHDLASDGARGIRAGVREAALDVPLQADLFHLMRDAHRITQGLERTAYKAIKAAEKVRRAEREAQVSTRRRGAPLKVSLTRDEAEAQEQEAMARYDLWRWLFHEARQALEPITADGNLMDTQRVRATIRTAAGLMVELRDDDVSGFAHSFLDHQDELLAPLVWLEDQVLPWRKTLSTADERFILWAWHHRDALSVDVEADFSPSLQPAARAYWKALSLFHRASSLAEALHSWLRPYLQAHRGMPQWLLPLLQLFWNHHPFQRGKRAGHSPLELAGVEDAPSLAEVIDRLFTSDSQTPSAVPQLQDEQRLAKASLPQAA